MIEVRTRVILVDWHEQLREQVAQVVCRQTNKRLILINSIALWLANLIIIYLNFDRSVGISIPKEGITESGG